MKKRSLVSNRARVKIKVKKGRQRRHNIPLEEIIKALELKKGFVSMAAKALRITHGGLDKRIHGSEELQEALRLINEKNLDTSESTLLTLISKKNLGATTFHLKCKGKNRGYVERQELAGPGGGPIPIQRLTVEFIKPSQVRKEK